MARVASMADGPVSRALARLIGLAFTFISNLKSPGERVKKMRSRFNDVFSILPIALGVLALLPMAEGLRAQPAAKPEPHQTTGAQASPDTNKGGSADAAAASHGASIQSPCDLPEDSGDGLAIFSGTLPLEHVRAFDYTLHRKGTLTDKTIVLSFFEKGGGDFFTGVFGKLFILRLPAGTYQFTDWSYTPKRGIMTQRPIGISPLTFEVVKGRGVYLGGFDPVISDGKNLFHEKVNTAWVLVHDDRTRDLPVLLKKCPAFDSKQLDLSVMDTTPWLPKQKK